MTPQRIGLSLAAAAAAALAPTALPALELTAGEWKFTFSGNVNAHYIYSSCEDEPVVITGGLACVAAGGEDSSSSISNGLLPAALSLSASTTQGGYDIGVTFGLYPGISTNDTGSPNLQDSNTGALNTALGTTSMDVRQVFLTFGNDRMGQFKLGRDLGLFQADAILFDMTIPGVGSGNGNYATPANTSLGSIGLGYIYADWFAQINYTTPDINGFKFTIGIFDPLEPLVQSLSGVNVPEPTPGIHGKISYTRDNWYFSASFLTMEHEGATDASDFDSFGFDIGGKVTFQGLEVMAYYYDAEGIGTTGLFVFSDDGLGGERDSDGFIAQVTYTFGGSGAGSTKVGVNYGESNLDLAPGEINPTLVKKNSKYTVGVYHNLTENLTLLAEFSDTRAKAQNGLKNDSSNFNIGAFVSF